MTAPGSTQTEQTEPSVAVDAAQSAATTATGAEQDALGASDLDDAYNLDEWCAALGIEVGANLAGWEVQPPLREAAAVVIVLQKDAVQTQFWIEPRNASRSCFGFSPSFNLSHRDLPDDDNARRVIRALAAAVVSNDEGDFPPPPYGDWFATETDDPTGDDHEIGLPLPVPEQQGQDGQSAGAGSATDPTGT